MRINLFGGPGAGKSTMASLLFYELKRRSIPVELASEFVKTWVYRNIKYQKYDQIYIFGKQTDAEYKYLSAGVKNVITDSPMFLSYFYAKHNGHPELAEHFKAIHLIYEKDYPSVNIFLNRDSKTFIQEGRYHNYQQAIEIDNKLKEELQENCKFFEFNYLEKEKILDTVLENIDK